MIRVALVDDHAIVRRGLRELFADSGHFSVVGEAASFAQWQEMSHEKTYDALVVDVNLPGKGGLDILSASLAKDPAARVLMLSHHTEEQYGLRAIKAGALGYLTKDADPEQIIEAVRRVGSGQPYVSPMLGSLLIDTVRNKGCEHPHDELSEREMQTMLFIARGIKPARIADLLSISPKTVSEYRSRVMRKLGVFTNAAITSYAVRHQLID